MTALHSAASNGSYEVCDLLLQHGADIRCRDEEDMTPLHFASMEGHVGKIEFEFMTGYSESVLKILALYSLKCFKDNSRGI